ncbi:MAG: hypothetical protein FD171_2003 [Actinobacteria bacterium]|nr:MAG: hypothetical protein FD171_2003 [Actinomycetota bacterium]MDO8950001.1 ABC transporter substrate-binding (seleno)protein SaoB [Actinomycetota bacterium]
MKLIATVILIVALGAGSAACTPVQPAGCGGSVRIGAPDDIAGMLVDRAVRLAPTNLQRTDDGLEVYGLRDCCSTNSQYALSSDSLDLAVLCPGAAADLVSKDRRFVVIGPLIENSDVVVTRSGAIVARMGVTQNRSYQLDIVREVVGSEATVVPMMTTSLPYALEKGIVDGIVIDAVKALSVPGDRRPSAPAQGDRVTYVLVAREDLLGSERYSMAIDLLGRAAEALNDPAVFGEEASRATGRSVTAEEVEEWQTLRVRLLHVSETARF